MGGERRRIGTHTRKSISLREGRRGPGDARDGLGVAVEDSAPNRAIISPRRGGDLAAAARDRPRSIAGRIRSFPLAATAERKDPILPLGDDCQAEGFNPSRKDSILPLGDDRQVEGFDFSRRR